MSIQFNDTTNYKGLAQIYEKLIGVERGFITGNTDRFKEFTADANIALDKAHQVIFDAGGTWQYDDSNQTDFPIITTNVVSGQRDYTFTTDQTGNLILEIYRVMVADSSGFFQEINPVDVQTGKNLSSFYDGQNTGGTPDKYDKTANGIFLDPVPNYNYTNGLKVYINREASYFTSSDTTKKPGFAGIFHKYIALLPAYEYAFRNSLSNTNVLRAEVQEMEQAIKDYYSLRDKHVRNRLNPNLENNK